MALFVIERHTPLPAGEAWRRLTDWERHAASVPLTRITVTATGFVARTGLGRAGFDDPMEVVHWEPPEAGRAGRCRLEKRGSVVTGWAELEVAPAGGGSVVTWREELCLRGLPRLLDPLLAPAGRRVFGRAMRSVLAD
ncbi:SRPBCC family protein [Streptomyces sannanensis]|uniref:SRPBCC family protein n=1 Tax=Streptomyces sannanensis TaxID=285536 RepID=A0ABP6S690_9ACTN